MRFDKLGKSFVLATLFAGLGATLTTGCAENRTSVFIYNVLAPPDDCLFQTGSDKAQLPSGVFIAGFPSYSVFFQVASQLTKLGDATVLRAETGYFAVEGAEVNLLSGDGGSTLRSFSIVTVSTIPPASGTQPGFGAVNVMLIPPDVASTLKDGDSVIAEVRIFGKTSGGIELQTPWSSFPIEVSDLPDGCDITTVKTCGTQYIGCGG